MSQINPLFLDSTKPIGDKVVTSVELFGVALRDGETIYLEIQDTFGFVQRFTMLKIETKKSVRYSAEVWLKYQHQIQYRFLIAEDGEEILTSKWRDTRAGHVISEKWEPCNKEVSKSKKDLAPTRPVREIKAKSTRPLCQPELFGQIKSLLEDLL